MAKRVPAGEMRHVVSIEKDDNEGVYDSYGQIVRRTDSDVNWVREVGPIRAKIETLRGREGELARQIYPNAVSRVTIDYQSELDSTGATRRRLCFGERALHIGAVINVDEENIVQELLCGEEK